MFYKKISEKNYLGVQFWQSYSLNLYSSAQKQPKSYYFYKHARAMLKIFPVFIIETAHEYSCLGQISYNSLVFLLSTVKR